MMCSLALALGACADSSEDASTADSSRPETSTSVAPDEDAACAAMSDFLTASSEIDGDDLDSLRDGFGHLVVATEDLRAAAPEPIADAAADLHEWAIETDEVVSDPEFELDPDTLYVWDTPSGAEAGEALAAWAEAACGDISDGIRPDVVLVLCLGSGAGDDVFEEVKPRLEVPRDDGEGIDLPAGIQGISWDYSNGEIDVELDRFITPEEREVLEQALREPPVLDVVTLEVPAGNQVPGSGGRTAGCP
jgi:hypothetical protein